MSVIIPVRNDARRLDACLAALHLQTQANSEIIVIDNGSQDESATVGAGRPGVRVLTESRPSSYAARNTGVRAARGAYLAFTDSDCLPDPEWLKKGIERLDRHPGSFIGGRVRVFPRDADRPTAVELYEMLHAFPQETYVNVGQFAVTANLLVRRADFERVGAFDATLISNGDTEWGIRAHRCGLKGIYAADACVAHPARRTFGELGGKFERVRLGQLQVAGADDAVGSNPARLALAHRPRPLRPPVRATLENFPRLQPGSRRSRTLYAAARVCVHYFKAYRRLRADLRYRTGARDDLESRA